MRICMLSLSAFGRERTLSPPVAMPFVEVNVRISLYITKKYLKKDKQRSDPWDFCYRDQSFIKRRRVGYLFSRKERY